MRIPQATIEQLNAQADLVSIIRRHTILKPAGKEFKGCCPFHGEKTPSFYVNPQTNLYYCFGCGVKGNAISFLVDFERMTFVEAVKDLASKTGIDLPKDDDSTVKYTRKTNKPHTASQAQPIAPPSITNNANTPIFPPPHQIDRQKHQSYEQTDNSYPFEPTFDNEPKGQYFAPPNITATTQTFDDGLGNDGNLYQLLQAVSKFYQAMLDRYPHARQYFVGRGLNDDIIAKFELGYAPDGWQHLEHAFPNDIEGLKILGLVRTSQKGRDFDLLRDRVIFPIKDRQGRIVGFAGRALDDAVLPKYVNSSDSIVFQKQHILYGLFESRQQRAQDWLVVEGYMDVIALYQAGIYGAVAPMGTAINEKQIDYLLKFNDILTLSFDGDSAGQRAALRALEVAMPVLPDGKSLKFLVLPDNHDPDTFIKEQGVMAMRTAIGNALPLSEFLYQILSQKYPLKSAETKAKIMAEVKELTAKLPKGSSFRWWLNSDIYNRLKDSPKPTAKTYAPTRPIISSEQLLLCLLYSPNLLQSDPLATLYQNTGLIELDRQFAQTINTPPLPTWQTLGIEGLSEFIATTISLLPFLNLTQPNAKQIDANAHIILSALSNKSLQAALGASWRDFIHHNYSEDNAQYSQTHNTIELLFWELLCQSVITALKNEQKTAKTLALSKLYKQRLIALENYDRQVIKPKIKL